MDDPLIWARVFHFIATTMVAGVVCFAALVRATSQMRRVVSCFDKPDGPSGASGSIVSLLSFGGHIGDHSCHTFAHIWKIQCLSAS